MTAPRRASLTFAPILTACVLVVPMVFGPPDAAGQERPLPDTLDGEPYGSVRSQRAIIYHAPRDSLVAIRVGELLDEQASLPGLPESVPDGVHAVLAHTPAAFDEAIGGAVPEWRAGVAIPARDMLVMPTGEGVRVVDGEGLRTLRHEWAHLGLHQTLGDLRIPRWFNEGYA
ncbi:MAG: hypothetical protein HKO77_07895, partial [Gemmatimonadetes bacterium]|nr:hypothetical protein [Gemmatimonadota bacterium]